MKFLEAATSSLCGCAKRIAHRGLFEVRKQLRGNITILMFPDDTIVYALVCDPEISEDNNDWEPI